jgi:Xaa-Pro aminopeptidase
VDLNAELASRFANVREAMTEHSLDALVVSGSEYSGFEGAVTYLSGFQIVHRYAYVVVPADGDPFIVFPQEARYVGEHGTTPLEQVLHPRPGEAIAQRARDAGWRRLGVYGLDHVMAVRDYTALHGLDLVSFDVEFDLARAVKSPAELESVRDSVRINTRGFEIWFEHYAPGKTAAEVMAAAEEWFVAEGCGRLTMNMVLTAPGRSDVRHRPGQRRLVHARHRVGEDGALERTHGCVRDPAFRCWNAGDRESHGGRDGEGRRHDRRRR